MIEIKNSTKSTCCGCTACVNICPKKAITMQEDEEGFLYPKVDKKKCINCGLCEKTCPIKNKLDSRNEICEAYAIRCKDEKVLKESTSGGFFTPIANYVIENGGVVYGVGFGKDFRVEHKRATKKIEVAEFRGSKYVQSYLGSTFQNVKKDLLSNKLVLFSGTPCQVEGLLKYLMKKYNNLITIDLICHGTPSPKMWLYYTKELEDKYKSKIKKIIIRNKTYGYHSGTMFVEFKNKKKYYGSRRIDPYLRSFFGELSSRPSCFDCKFKTKKHNSDFTIYDCWSFSKMIKEIPDDDKGYTNIMVNTSSGKKLLDITKEHYIYYKVDVDEQIKNDGIYVEKSIIPHKKRNEFYNELYNLGISNNGKKFFKISITDRLLERSKGFLYKTGLLKLLKKMKGK